MNEKKELYEIGETVKITGRSNQVWTEDLELQILQTGIVNSISSDSYQALSPFSLTEYFSSNGESA